MASISFDERSFLVDGRRIWLISGAIHYARTPRRQWRARLRAAREAGLNCIETYVFWNLHERSPGRFDFSGDRDLRRFVEMVGEEGMYCILRPGPYVCAEWDGGGFPPWLNTIEGIRFREANRPFMEACARYLRAVMEQVRDLQLTTPTEGLPPAPSPGNVPGEAAGGYTGAGRGPIVLMQVENEWLCHNDEQVGPYLNELVRYLRENGCEVPLNNCNNLWQRVEGTIDTWNANEHLAADLRQLGLVQPDRPRIVMEYWTGWFDHWGADRSSEVDAGLHLHRLGQILASGAQPNLYMFHGGTNFGFTAGRSVFGPDCFITTSYDYDAPLGEAGERGAKYQATKQVCTFASQFHHVFAHLEHRRPHTAVLPEEVAGGPTVIHQSGSQGDVVFLLRGQKDRTRQIDLLLPRGLRLPVSLGRDRAAWLLLDVSLAGRARLDYTNLRPLAFLDRQMLVLFGPAGSEGLVSLNDAPLQVQVPTGKQPLVEQVEGLTLVVLNEQQVESAYPYREGLVVGADGLDDAGEPRALSGWSRQYRITPTGDLTQANRRAPRKPAAPKLNDWSCARLDAILDGSDEGFTAIDGPTSFDHLGEDGGYGWYRLRLGGARSGKVFAPGAGDRLHVYGQNGLQGVYGRGPGAAAWPASMRLGKQSVVLADHLGRSNFGNHVGELKGLFDHLYKVQPRALDKPEVEASRAPDPFELRGFVMFQRRGERGPAERLSWTFEVRGKRKLILELEGLAKPAMILVNDQPISYYDPFTSAGYERCVLDPGVEPLKRGKNRLSLALFGPFEKAFTPTKHLRLYDALENLTEKAAWAFRRWEPPGEEAYGAMPEADSGRPCWYRATFSVTQTGWPLWLEPRGLSKGQIYVNGHNAGRYFVARPDGKAVPPQERYYLPAGWLNADGPNTLALFEEHGRLPQKVRLSYGAG